MHLSKYHSKTINHRNLPSWISADASHQECRSSQLPNNSLPIRPFPAQIPSGTGIGTSLARLFIAIGCKLLGICRFAGVVQW